MTLLSEVPYEDKICSGGHGPIRHVTKTEYPYVTFIDYMSSFLSMRSL